MDNDKLREILESAAIEAAGHLYNAATSKSTISVQAKADHTIVMNLDLECQDIIGRALKPYGQILSEEDESSHSLIGTEQDFFIVDPIDGTASCRRYLGIEGGQIGFGPLVGYAKKGKLFGAAYFNLPTRILFSAILGNGAQMLKFESGLARSNAGRVHVMNQDSVPLDRSALLFYPGSLQELETVMHWRSIGLVENTYRLGGFASDCTRVASGHEQIDLQCRVKAWDFSATLIAQESGLDVLIDPFGGRIAFADWKISADNPVLIAHPDVAPELVRNLPS